MNDEILLYSYNLLGGLLISRVLLIYFHYLISV